MSAKKQQILGEFIFEYLYKKGVRHAFGIPGDFALPTFRWLDKSKLDLITLTHEPSVGFAADGYARIHGLGVAVVTYCVGGLNMLNSIACAYAEKSPVLVISGGPSAMDRKKDPLLHHKVKTFDTQRRVFEEVTCANTVLSDPETAASEIMRVVDAVLENCRPGYIEIPFDLVDMMVAIPEEKEKEKPVSDEESLRECLLEAVEFINRSKKPVILADVELHRHGLTHHALEIAEKFNIPIASTLLSKSVISETHPLYIGVYSGAISEPETQEYVDTSDCVIMLGTFLTDVLLGLNTSELTRKNSIMVTTETARVGYHHYEEVVFEDFLNGIKNSGVQRRGDFKNPIAAPNPKVLSDSDKATPLASESFFSVLSGHIDDGDTIVCDTGDSLLGAINVRTTKSSNFISDAYYLSMGFGVPASIGVMAANPSSRTFVIVGDGAFQMTGMELSTAIKNGMKPIVCLLNNDGYGTQRHIIDGPFNNILQWDYTAVTKVFGKGKSIRVKTLGELDSALNDAKKNDEMTFIEVIIPREDSSRPLRRLAGGLKKLRDNG